MIRNWFGLVERVCRVARVALPKPVCLAGQGERGGVMCVPCKYEGMVANAGWQAW